MSEIFQEKSSCVICGSSEYSPYFESVHDRFNVSEVFSIVKCCDCGFIYLNPRPTETSMSKYYDIEEYHPHKLSSESLFDNIYEKIRQININSKRKLIEKLKPLKGSLLDIGCGTGEFIHHMHNQHWIVKGMETASEARNTATQNEIKIYENLNIIDDRFDIISMWHTLEHIHDINGLMKNIHRLLNPDGFLLIAVPNIESVDSKYYKSHWVALDTPRHLYHFRPEDIYSLFTNYDFKLKKMNNILYFDVWYNVLLSAQLSAQRKQRKASIIDYFMAGLIGKLSFFTGLFNNKYASSPIYILTKK